MATPDAITEAVQQLWLFTPGVEITPLLRGEPDDDGNVIYEVFRPALPRDIDEIDAYLGYLYRQNGTTVIKYSRARFIAIGGDDLIYDGTTPEMTFTPTGSMVTQ